jgi:hypothetical protein
MMQSFLELLDTEKLRRARINFCLARSENFAVPFGRLKFLRFIRKRSPEPFHSLKALGFAQAGDFFSIPRRSSDANIAAAIGMLKNLEPKHFRGPPPNCG